VPTKAIYQRFETSPDLEFDHYLCMKLGWRSVEEMRRRMPSAEWQHWRIYFLRRAQERELAEQSRG
jgi:hypothetical protein